MANSIIFVALEVRKVTIVAGKTLCVFVVIPTALKLYVSFTPKMLQDMKGNLLKTINTESENLRVVYDAAPEDTTINDFSIKTNVTECDLHLLYLKLIRNNEFLFLFYHNLKTKTYNNLKEILSVQVHCIGEMNQRRFPIKCGSHMILNLK